MRADVSAAALWLGSLELAGLGVFALAALVDLGLRRRSAATRRGLWALTIAVALALPLARLALTAPAAPLAPGLAATLLALWGGGALLLLLRMVRGHALARGRRSRSAALDDAAWLASTRALQDAAARPRVELRVSDEIDGPQTTGVLRPAILVPRRMLGASAAERRALLAHELAHVARADCLLLLAGAAARAIYWISPLPWWALRRLRAHAEDAADDAVLQRGIRSSSYASQLVAAAREQLERAGRVAADGLRERVRGVLDGRRVRSPAPAHDPRRSVPRLVAAAALFAAVATACEARSSEGPTPPLAARR